MEKESERETRKGMYRLEILHHTQDATKLTSISNIIYSVLSVTVCLIGLILLLYRIAIPYYMVSVYL